MWAGKKKCKLGESPHPLIDHDLIKPFDYVVLRISSITTYHIDNQLIDYAHRVSAVKTNVLVFLGQIRTGHQNGTSRQPFFFFPF